MKHTLAIPVEIFKRGVLIFFGSPSGLRDAVSKYYPDKAAQKVYDDVKAETLAYQAMTIKTLPDPIIYAKKPIEISVLIHEIVHCATYILEQIDCQDDETRAYLTEYLYSQSYKFVEEEYAKNEREKKK